MDLIAHFKGARNLVFIQAGVPLFSEGEPGNSMYVLMEGSAAVVVAGQVIEVAVPGALLGEMALVDSSVRSATALARTNCRVLPINSTQFDLLTRESPEFARHVMTVMASRLRRMNRRLLEAVYSEPSIRNILRRKDAGADDNVVQFSRGNEGYS
jgi:CRP-like cAMP-binding protein